MAVQIESYQRISRPAIPANVAYVPPTGQQYAARARAIQGEAAASTINSIIGMVGSVAEKAVGVWIDNMAKVDQANKAAELSKETMETIQEYDDEANRLDQVETLPEPADFYPTEGGIGEELGAKALESYNWQRYYKDDYIDFTRKTLEKHLAKIRDPEVRARYQEFVSQYVQKSYGDFVAKGMVRDTNRAISDTNKALALAVDQKNKPMVETILGAAQLGANPLITPDKARELQETLFTQIDENGFTEGARAMGNAGPAWMLNPENQKTFNIKPERAAELSKAMQADMNVARAAQEIVDLPKRKQSYELAIDLIDQGKWTSIDEMDKVLWTDQSGNAFTPTLYDDDKESIVKYWNAKANAQQKAMDDRRDETLDIVNDLIKGGDYEGAHFYLNSLAQQGYSPTDLKILRAAEALQLAESPPGGDQFGKDCVSMELKLVDGTMTQRDLHTFAQKYQTKEGQEKLSHFREGWEQLQEAGTKVSKDVQDKYEADYLQQFMKVYYNPLVDEPALLKLSQWISRNSVNNEKDPKMPGISPSYQSTWTAKIMDKIDEMRSADKKLVADRLAAGRSQIDSYFDPLINNNKGNAKKYGTYLAQKWNALQQYDALAPNAKDPTQTALDILKPFDEKYVNEIMNQRAKLVPPPERVDSGVKVFKPVEGIPLYLQPGYAESSIESMRQAYLSMLLSPDLAFTLQAAGGAAGAGAKTESPKGTPSPPDVNTQAASEQRSRDMATLNKWKDYQKDSDGSVHFEGHKDAKGNYDWFEAYNTVTSQWEKVKIEEAQEYVNAWTRQRGNR